MTYRYCPRCSVELTNRHEGGRDRLVCGQCSFVHWDNPLPVVAALVEYEGKILLARNAAWPAHIFALITGFLERDESPEQGVQRELLEETNLSAISTELIGVYPFERKNELIIAYHVVAQGDIRLSEELVDYRLIDPERLKPWPMGTGLAMADWMTRRGIPVEFLDFGA